MGYDAIVIGAGVMGLSTAFELAQRGKRVLLLEQFDLQHPYGSSHGATRVIRTAYFEHPDYVPLAQRAWDKWMTMGDFIVKTGGLYVGPRDSPLIAGSIEAAEKHGLTYELDGGQLNAARKQMRVPEGFATFWEADCGVLMASAAVDHLVNRCRDQGVKLCANAALRDWSATDTGVRVTTDSSEFEADFLAICAGPWASQVLDHLKLSLVVTRQVVAYTEPANPLLFTSDRFPVTCFTDGDGAFYYAIPICNSGNYRTKAFKVGRHNPGCIVSPNSVQRTSTVEDIEFASVGLQEFIPGALGRLVSSEICLYTSTPDGHFIIDLHPEYKRVAYACGFSGHGFKFAPVVGEALSDLMLHGRSELPVQFLRIDRFNR
jgi:sarcosine oxidase